MWDPPHPPPTPPPPNHTPPSTDHPLFASLQPCCLQSFGPWWSQCQSFNLVYKICFYGSTDVNSAGQPYSIAGIQLHWTDNTTASAGRFDGSASKCLTLDVDNNEIITSIQINNIDNTNGDIDQVIIYTNNPSNNNGVSDMSPSTRQPNPMHLISTLINLIN